MAVHGLEAVEACVCVRVRFCERVSVGDLVCVSLSVLACVCVVSRSVCI